jgi:hypothetical protein
MSSAQDQIDRVVRDSDQGLAVPDENPLAPDIHPDRTRQFAHTGLSRMQTRWRDADQMRLDELDYLSDQIMRQYFKVAFDIMEQVWLIVRSPVIDPVTQLPKTGGNGRVLWIADEFGNPEENWDELDQNTRRRLLFAITTHLFEWEQARDRMWGHSMLAKVIWEERFATGFLDLPGMHISGKPTVDDKTQAGHRHSLEDRYFGVFQSMLSRQADSVVRAMTRLHKMLSEMTDA